MKSLLRQSNNLKKLSREWKQIRFYHTSIISYKDGIQVLEKDHNEVREMFKQYKQTSSPEEKEKILTQMIKELSKHTSAEEQYLYPLINEKLLENGKLLYDKNLLDDQINKEMLQFFEDHRAGKYSNPGDISLYNATVSKFMMNLEEHMKEEENLLFPELREKLSATELNNLGDNLQFAKQHAPKKTMKR
ncbi:hypothetical protein ABK040_005741 [Willaertia magna]